MKKALIVSATALTLVAGIGFLATHQATAPEPERSKAAVRDSTVDAEVVAADPNQSPVWAGSPGSSGFTENVQLGFNVGVGWEPAIAVDRYDHVYVLYAQYSGVPGCPECASPSAVLQVSSDGGETWDSPRLPIPIDQNVHDGQWDPQIVVDPIDGRTVYASWLHNWKGSIAVAKSIDFGETWTLAFADDAKNLNDKPIVIVRGQDVYVAWSQYNANTMWFGSSHDGGETFTSVKKPAGHQGMPLAAGGAVTSDGTVYFAWGGYQKKGSASGEITLYVTRSYDGGATWDQVVVGNAWPAAECSEPCGWGYLSSQMVMAADVADNLYVLWDGAEYVGDPGRMWFNRSTDGGDTWSERVDVSNAAADSTHSFPAITALGDGEVAIAWQDARNSAPFGQSGWQTYYRSSDDGGLTWSDEVQISSFVEGAPFYSRPDGYDYPYGDYFEIELDASGDPHLIWGAGESYNGVGNVWYSRGYSPPGQ